MKINTIIIFSVFCIVAGSILGVIKELTDRPFISFISLSFFFIGILGVFINIRLRNIENRITILEQNTKKKYDEYKTTF